MAAEFKEGREMTKFVPSSPGVKSMLECVGMCGKGAENF